MKGNTKLLAVIAVFVVVAAAVGAVYVMGNEKSQPLSVVYLNKSGYEALIVADNKGFFDELDFEVKQYFLTGSGQDAVNAMIAGTADIAATGDGPVINALNQYGEEIMILCSYAISSGGQVWVAQKSLVGTEIIIEGKTPAEIADQLKGSGFKVGVIKGSTTESTFKRWCTHFGLTYNETAGSDLQLVYLTGNTLVSSFATGSINILAGSQPYPATVISEAEGVQIGSSDDIGVYGTAALVTTRSVYENKTDEMKAFVAAMKKSNDYINANLDECIDICADRIEWSKAAQTASFEGSEPRIAFNDTVVDIMFETSKGKKFDAKVTKDVIIAACPLKEYIEGLYA